MATLHEVGQAKQRISERLSQLDAERTKLSGELNELETAERVLTRFGGKTDGTKGRRIGNQAGTQAATPDKHRPQGGQQAPLLSKASLKAGRHCKATVSNTVQTRQ